jgi:hypothetical protein
VGAINDFSIDQGGHLEALAEHIERRLKERAFCIVFEDEIERFWPRKNVGPTEREEQIQAFAKSHGWSVSILHDFESSRTRAIFLPF